MRNVRWIDGRIIAASFRDGYQRWESLQPIILMVDKELGVNRQITIQPKIRSTVYLAIASSQIIGFCDAGPITNANKLLTTIGADNESENVHFSNKMYPVR
jgi:hypothetical protein